MVSAALSQDSTLGRNGVSPELSTSTINPLSSRVWGRAGRPRERETLTTWAGAT
jgi:hypothetical protein